MSRALGSIGETWNPGVDVLGSKGESENSGPESLSSSGESQNSGREAPRLERPVPGFEPWISEAKW